MNISAKNLVFTAVLGLSGCASMFGPAPAVGDTEAETVAKRGPPSAVYQDGQDRLLSYAPGYNGQYSYMARVGPDDRLKSYEQVWTTNKFAEIKPNVSNSDDVLRIVGAPSMVQHYARTPNVGWNYGYREAGAWNSMMTVYIDPNGIVRGLENGPDPRYERDGMLGFGF
ncbi:MAG TPA: hypothetical protein VGN04_08090 [Herbaspirillum sp.]|jgi:hypothetical protein